jgi:hypothetical protein
MLDDYNLPTEPHGNSYFTRVPDGHPALAELKEAGYAVEKYHMMNNKGKKVIFVPGNDWNDLAAKQRLDAAN